MQSYDTKKKRNLSKPQYPNSVEGLILDCKKGAPRTDSHCP